MSLGGQVLRQHVVEFIPGTGQVTDGVVDATSTTGPWTWPVPDNVAMLDIDGCGGGGGGAGGFTTTTSRGGGGGGGSAVGLRFPSQSVRPKGSLVVTLAAAGTAGAAGANGVQGGVTTIAGLIFPLAITAGTLTFIGGGKGNTPGATSVGGAAGGGGVSSSGGTTTVSGAAGGAVGAVGTAGSGVATFASDFYSGFTYSGGGGGGANATGTVAGATGGGFANSGTSAITLSLATGNAPSVTSGTGTTDATNSYGGGGVGGMSRYGFGGAGGNGNVAGGAATGYGSGGGGGGGNAAGGAGAPGYARFTYWSMD